MKVAVSIAVAVFLPFGFLVLAGIIVNHMLAKRRQLRPIELQTLSASTQETCTSQPAGLSLCKFELQRAAA